MSEEANQLYHYTSMNALFQILNGIENGNLTLRATHYQYLNDTTECKLVDRYISECLSLSTVISHNSADTYIISLSSLENDLSMYRLYSGKNGVSLCFRELSSNEGKIVECDYIKNIDEIRNKYFYVDSVNSVNSLLSFVDCNAQIKHSSFEPEQEKRLVVDNKDKLPVKFFEKNGLIKPYIEVQIPITALKQIWLAPECNEELSRKSILMLLGSKGVTHITENDIIHSKHPYIDR